MNRTELITKLGQYRRLQNVSANELSLRIDKAHNYVSLLEAGKVNISYDALHAICNELNIEIILKPKFEINL